MCGVSGRRASESGDVPRILYADRAGGLELAKRPADQHLGFDSNVSGSQYMGQGDHSLSVGDVDGDGKMKLFMAPVRSTMTAPALYHRLGAWRRPAFVRHGSDRPGLEVWNVHETPNPTCGGGEFRDARTGRFCGVIRARATPGLGLRRQRGCQHARISNVVFRLLWIIFHTKGQNIGRTPGSDNFLVWWDADVSRELLDAQ